MNEGRSETKWSASIKTAHTVVVLEYTSGGTPA